MARAAAVAALVLAFAACAAATCAPAGSIYYGGATSVTPLENQVLSTYGKYGCYGSVGSGAGYTNFKSGLYQIADSDAAMTLAQESGLGFSKYTIPQGAQSYAMLYNGATQLSLSCVSIAQLYSGAASSIGGGAITIPVARGDSSGTTFIFTTYLSLCAGSAWSSSKVAEQLLAPNCPPCSLTPPATCPTWGSSKIVCQTGSNGVASYVFSHPGAICYVGDPVAVTFVTGNIRIAATNNKAGAYYKSNACSVCGSIPVSFPSASATWSSVQTVFNAGSNTCPMASLIYVWARQSYPAAGTSSCTQSNCNCAGTKAFLTFMFSTSGQNLLAPLSFVSIASCSPTLLTQNKNAVNAIKCT